MAEHKKYHVKFLGWKVNSMSTAKTTKFDDLFTGKLFVDTLRQSKQKVGVS